MSEFEDINKFNVLKQIAMLLRWFDECTTTTIGSADYDYLVQNFILWRNYCCEN